MTFCWILIRADRLCSRQVVDWTLALVASLLSDLLLASSANFNQQQAEQTTNARQDNDGRKLTLSNSFFDSPGRPVILPGGL
jgi:hypothetical protein